MKGKPATMANKPMKSCETAVETQIKDNELVRKKHLPDNCINFADKWAFKPFKRGLSLNFRVNARFH